MEECLGYMNKKIEKGFKEILVGLHEELGLNLDDVNLEGTPQRVAKAYLEMLQGIDHTKPLSILKTHFPSTYTGMVILTDIQCYGMCPHHFLPVRYNVNFAYIPAGHVLGLSKIPRFIKIMVQAPVLQEDVTKDIVNRFFHIVNPLGCMVTLDGQHQCMGCRGVEMPGVSTITSAHCGVFEEAHVKQEFFTHIELSRTKK